MVLSKDSKGLGPKKNVDPDKLLEKMKVPSLLLLSYSLTNLLAHSLRIQIVKYQRKQ
jgi:hypothetical protein